MVMSLSEKIRHNSGLLALGCTQSGHCVCIKIVECCILEVVTLAKSIYFLFLCGQTFLLSPSVSTWKPGHICSQVLLIVAKLETFLGSTSTGFHRSAYCASKLQQLTRLYFSTYTLLIKLDLHSHSNHEWLFSLVIILYVNTVKVTAQHL